MVGRVGDWKGSLIGRRSSSVGNTNLVVCLNHGTRPDDYGMTPIFQSPDVIVLSMIEVARDMRKAREPRG